jgi:hypothetical protein
MMQPQEFRLETRNGVFTILDFKPKVCSLCGGKLTSRRNSHRKARILHRCRRCVCSENGYSRNYIFQTTMPNYYDESGVFDVEARFKHWWIERATVRLEA